MSKFEYNMGDLVSMRIRFVVETGEIITDTEKLLYYDKDPKYTVLSERTTDYTKIWCRVMYMDEDFFIGKVERREMVVWYGKLTPNSEHIKSLDFHEIGDDLKILHDHVNGVYDPNSDWCYSDYVTQCKCPGLCRNK